MLPIYPCKECYGLLFFRKEFRVWEASSNLLKVHRAKSFTFQVPKWFRITTGTGQLALHSDKGLDQLPFSVPLFPSLAKCSPLCHLWTLGQPGAGINVPKSPAISRTAWSVSCAPTGAWLMTLSRFLAWGPTSCCLLSWALVCATPWPGTPVHPLDPACLLPPVLHPRYFAPSRTCDRSQVQVFIISFSSPGLNHSVIFHFGGGLWY